MCTTEKFQEVTEDSRKRSRLKVSSYRGGCLGYQHFEDKINVLKTNLERGELVLDGGRDDILARALKKPEHGGCVRGVGSCITITEYFGFSKPTPPSQMRAELTSLRSEMGFLRNNLQLMMIFIMKCQNAEQMKQLMVSFGLLGNLGGQDLGQFTGFDGYISGQDDGQLNSAGHGNDMFDTVSKQPRNLGGHSDDHFCAMSG
ncbi:hypothetical protein KSS87_011037 [Heliosperma pusillum]|nr:hypothetical protein KSS87_011037 [Heliosperma pusillum]